MNQIVIGMAGPQNMMDKLARVVQDFPSFSPIQVVVHSEEEIPLIARQLVDRVDVLLLSDSLAQRKVKESLDTSIPVHHVPITEAGMYKALFRAMKEGRLTSGISVDTLTASMVNRCLKDLGMLDTYAAIYDGPAYDLRDRLVRFHQQQYERMKCSLALTAVESVSRRLTELGVPNEWLEPSERDMIVTLERALLSTSKRQSREAQIVVGLVHVDDCAAANRGDGHEVQKLKLEIHRMILEYVQSLDGYLTQLGGDQYLFFTTRGIFERETGGYKTIPLAKDAGHTYGVSLSIGIGFGRSANEAGTHARTALRKAKEAGGNACFIVREDGTFIGPLEMSAPVREVLAITDGELIKKAEGAGMTSAYLSKLLHQMARFGKQEYTVHELAALLNISVRSAHRLLLAWMDHRLVEVTSMEKVPRGRPRQIFRFSFLNESYR